MASYEYHCYFARYSYKGVPQTTVTKVPSIASVMAGFWVNKEGEHTVGEDRAVWIAPSSIMCVEKVDIE